MIISISNAVAVWAFLPEFYLDWVIDIFLPEVGRWFHVISEVIVVEGEWNLVSLVMRAGVYVEKGRFSTIGWEGSHHGL